MRDTFSSLILASQNYCVDPQITSTTALSDTKTFIKKEINNQVRLIYNKLGLHKVQKQQTAATVSGQQFYHLPPDFVSVETLTHAVGGVTYPLQSVESAESWTYLNQVDFSGSIIPQFYFVRRDDFGIWPEPTTSDETITLDYNYLLRDMSNEDDTDGTVSVTQNSTTVTGSSTTFTAGMVGRWFKANDDGDWYRISAFTSTTDITLETSFEGASVSGSNFVIGESPEIPMETHQYIPYGTAATYFATIRRDPKQAQAMSNYFWTGDFSNYSRKLRDAAGGLNAIINRYRSRGRSNSQIVRRSRQIISRFDERWRSTLS
jgi:hypothetical protein